MNKLAAVVTTTVLVAVAGNVAASARESEPRDDHGTAVSTAHRQTVLPEAGDDHRRHHAEPGDDHGRHHGSATERGDDHGRHHGSGTEPGDDHGSSTEPGDDHGSSTEP